MKVPKSTSIRGGAKTKTTATISPTQSTPAVTAAKPTDLCGVRQIGNEVVFVTLCPDCNTVQVAGDFNNWQPDRNPMKKIGNEGLWQCKMRLIPGTYRYRLVIDGNWQQDPFNSHVEPNPYGQFNSVVTVK